MNRNKITDKLLYTFGISGILLCLNSLPVSAQQRYPTAAAIQKARNQLRQRLGVLSSNGRLRDSRSQSEKQTRNNFVAIWNKIDPDVAPFLGQWRGYEASFAIYPSNRKGQVCIMMSSFGWMDIEMGKVSNGNIYTDTGGLFFKEGNYLDLAAPLKNGGLSEGIPLHAPMPLKEPSIDEEIEDRYKAAKVIRAYKQAGCTASLPSNNNVSQTNIENLADGFYLYGEIPNADGFGKHYVVFGKSGKTITGYSYVTNTDNIYCFQGTGRGNQIVNATSITRILNPPNSYDAISSNQSLNLNGFYPIKSSEESKRKSVTSCLEKINKNITSKIPSTPPKNPKIALQNRPEKTFKTTKDFGVRQFLKQDYDFEPIYDKLTNAANGKYNLAEVPDSDSMAKSFATIQPLECRGDFGCRNSSVKVSYADYLKLKLQLKEQGEILQQTLNKEDSIYLEVEQYKQKLSQINRQKERAVAQYISNGFDDFIANANNTHKNPSLLERLTSKKQWTYALEELKYSIPNFTISVIGTGAKAAASLPGISNLIDTLTIPKDFANSFQKKVENPVKKIQYIKVSADKIAEMKDALLAGNFEVIQQINLDMAEETIDLIESDSSLKQIGEVASAYSAAKALRERDKMIEELEALDILDSQDKNYFYASQAADSIEFTASIISSLYPESFRKKVPQKYKKYLNVLEAIKPVKDVLYESLANSYKDSFIRNYVETEAMVYRNQKTISELHTWIDDSGEQVGEYLLQKYGKDIVGLGVNKKNVYVMKDNIFYPSK